MGKKKKSSEPEERKVHKVSFKKEPIWLKMNVIGKYEGIKYRFTYKEYCSEEADEVIKNFQFNWPGRIPEDKAFAEEGIKAMFLQQLGNGGFSYKVVKDEADKVTSLEEEESLLEGIEEIGDYTGVYDDII